VLLAGLAVLALLGVGEAAPAAWPVWVRINIQGESITVAVDGAVHQIHSGLGAPYRGVAFEQPGPLRREYQIDGSDTTSTGDRQPLVIASLLSTPLYAVDAWLRDESSLSRWEWMRVVDPATGSPLPTQITQTSDNNGARTELMFLGDTLPDEFRVEAALRRPEAAAHLWLLGTTIGEQEGLELDRDRRNARWVIERTGATETLPRWFFPEEIAPFAAELLHLVGRCAVAAFALVAAVSLLGRVVRVQLAVRRPPPLLEQSVIAVWLLGAALLTTRLYHQLPHILDAVSYVFGASTLRSGRLALEAPDLVDAFKGPFEVVWRGQWFSQYPPGAPVAYALGSLVSLEWLAGPTACVVLIGATTWTARELFGHGVGLVVLAFGVLSPFVLFQSGSFLSHPIAGGLLAAALACFVVGERTSSMRWFGAAGALLGVGFLTREAASVLFALPLVARAIATRRWLALEWLIACGLPFVAIYLLYNDAVTGNALLLPRTIFDASDRFGFGDGFGFHRRHTLAAGLANTDELLTLLQFDLLGWPPLFGLAILVVPFLLGRARSWDAVAGFGVLAFVAAYTAYFYHGVALGPRYYFEAVPWLLLLAGRGAQVLAQVGGSRLIVATLVCALSLNNVLFYLPTEIRRRVDFSALPEGGRYTLAFVRVGVTGPRLDNVPAPSLVLTSDWWVFNASLAALNCPTVPDCPVLFALATNPDDARRLRAAYPGRLALRAINHDGRVDLEPD
jgi:hypothetical protein